MTDLNILNDPDPISLAALARREHVHLSTPWRWALSGERGTSCRPQNTAAAG